MTVIADAKKRVVLPPVEPGDRFDVQVEGARLVLTKLVKASEPAPNTVRFVKRHGRTVGVIDGAKPFDEAALKQALDDFP